MSERTNTPPADGYSSAPPTATTEGDFEDRLRAFATSMSSIGDSGSPSPWLPPDAPSPIGAPLVERMRRLRLSFSKAGQRTHRQSDAAATRDLRVASRRLIATLSLWRELFRSDSRKRALRQLRSLRGRMGAVRDLEVQVAGLEGFDRQRVPSDAPLLEPFLKNARQRLSKERRRAAERVRPGRLRDLIETLERTGSRIETKAAGLPQALDLARQRVVSHARDAAMAVGMAQERRDTESLHEARIAVKKWRYAKEAMGIAAEEDNGPTLASLRELQDILGVIQNGASLRDVLVPEPGTSTETLECLNRLIEVLDRERCAALERFLAVAPAVLRRVSLAIVGQ